MKKILSFSLFFSLFLCHAFEMIVNEEKMCERIEKMKNKFLESIKQCYGF